MGRVARMFVLAWLAAGCLAAPGSAQDGGDPDGGGGGPDAGRDPGMTRWVVPLALSLPYIALDGDELVAVAGFLGTVELDPPLVAAAGGTDLLVAGFTAEGEQRFATAYGGPADELVTAVTVSPVSGQIGVFGLYGAGQGNVGGEALPAPTAGYHLVVARYDRTGAHLWSLPGVASDGAGSSFTMGMSGSGALTLSGDYSSTLALGEASAPWTGTGRDLFFARVSPAGVVPALVGTGGPSDQIGAGALYDGLGDLYFFGTTTGSFMIDAFTIESDGTADLFVCQMNDTGTEVSWLIDSAAAGEVGALRGAVTPDGSLVLTGWFEGTFAFDLPDAKVLTSRGGSDVFVAVIRPDGTVGQLEQFGGPGDDEPRGIAIGPDGEIGLTGSFRLEAGLEAGDPLVTSKGGADIFVLSLAADHSLRWARSFGDVEDDSGISIAVGPGGTVSLGALYRGEVDFGGPAPLETSGGESEAALIGFW